MSQGNFDMAEICRILSKPTNSRTHKEMTFICDYLWTVKFFRESFDQIVEQSTKMGLDPPRQDSFTADLANGLQYQEIPAGKAVIHCGDYGDRMFIVLKGELDIYLPKNSEEIMKAKEAIESFIKKTDKELQAMNQANTKKSLRTRRSSILSDSVIPEKIMSELVANNMVTTTNLRLLTKFHSLQGLITESDLATMSIGKLDSYFEEGVFKFKKVGSSQPGAVFGEVALQTDAPRAATIIARQKASVTTLSRQVFKKIFASALNKVHEKVDFFKTNFPFLQNTSLVKFSYEFFEKRYSRGSVLFRQGEPIEEVFLIKEGSVEVFPILSTHLLGVLNSAQKDFQTH